MVRHPQNRLESSAPTSNSGQDQFFSIRPHQDPATHASQTGQAGPAHPLDGAGTESKTCTNYNIASFGASYKFAGVRGSGAIGGVTSGRPVKAKRQHPSGEHPAPLRVTERLYTSQPTGEPLSPWRYKNPDVVHINPTSSSRQGCDGPITSFTMPPTEEDLRRMQPGRNKNGYIKRPMNAFMVWLHIHRYALCKTCPRASLMATTAQLSCVWSKLSEEQKSPYYEVAHKLKFMHRQQFPDYQFRPQRKKSKGQGARPEAGVSSFVSQAMPPAQSKLLGPSIYACSLMKPYQVGYDFPSSCPHHPMSLYSRAHTHHSRCQTACSHMEEVVNYHNAHLQMDETTLHPAHEVLAGSTITSETLVPPNIVAGQHPSANNKVKCNCGDDIDVVGLF